MSFSATTRNNCSICSCESLPLASGVRSGREVAAFGVDGADLSCWASTGKPASRIKDRMNGVSPGFLMLDITFLEGNRFPLDARPMTNDQPLTTVLVSFAQQLPLKQALVHAVQAFSHSWSDQRVVLDIEQVINDEPDRLVGGHPVLA